MFFTYKYARPALTVDCVVFAIDFEQENLKLLLIQRGEEPFKGHWALPGGFVHNEEDLEAAARRELKEETGLDELYLEQLYTFGAINRDPRDRVVTVAYVALVNISGRLLQAATDAQDAAWFDAQDLPETAFDHASIIETALQRLRGKLSYQPVGFELLPERFTLSQLQKVYEIVLDQKLDKRNFRKRILQMDILRNLDEIQKDVAHRAARLYSFDRNRYTKLLRQGQRFEL